VLLSKRIYLLYQRETSKIIIVSINYSQIKGKIWDFDEEHLILYRENEQIAIPWDEITWIGVRDVH
jgi:hypothetical protein